MKFVLFALVLVSASVFASSDLQKDMFAAKVNFEQKANLLKLSKEQQLMSLADKSEFYLSSVIGIRVNDVSSCVEFVYQGPSSREEAVAACRGVRSLECVKFVYQGPASRVEAAQACRGVEDMECVKFVYQGPASRVEAAQSCSDGRDPRSDGPRRPDGC
ncbi:MAG: hypothetical protein Q7U04_12525 [Bacteriovorax sp.]|nr:hypothetical protein [Bacteriovorax sp.]